MVKDDFWSEPIDDLSNVEASTIRGNRPIFDDKLGAAQSLQLATNGDTVSSSQLPIIPKTSVLSAPIIYEDIWGDDVGEPTVTETPFSLDQTLYADKESIKEWTEDEELLGEPDGDKELFQSENIDEISDLPIASPFEVRENATDLLTELEDFDTLSALGNVLEQDILLDDLELLDIDAALAELNEEEKSLAQTEKRTAGVVSGRGNVPGWMGSYGLFYINWEYGAEAEQEALKRLGYAELEISEATRAFVIQAARAARLPRHQERELTTKLDHTRLLLAQLSRCNDPEIDPYLEERTALNAEIADLERTLVYKMQWVAIKKAVQFMGRGIDLDDLIQYGMLGVIAGVKHYDVSKNTRLLTAISWWVFQSLNRALAENVFLLYVPVYIAETLANIRRQHSALQITLGRSPNLRELADASQVPVERLKGLLHLNEKPISWEQCKIAEDTHEGYSFQPLENTSIVNEDTLDDETDELDIMQNVEAMLQLLSTRERQVVSLRYGLYDEEMQTLEEVGKVLHITRERVRQIENRAFEKIRSDYHLKKKVIKVQDSPQKIEENTVVYPIVKTVSRHEPKQRKTSQGSKPPSKVNNAKSQRRIIVVEGHNFEMIGSRRGFYLRSIPDQEVTD